MKLKNPRADVALRVLCAIAMSVAAVLFVFIFVALCIQWIRHDVFSNEVNGPLLVLTIIGLLTLFSTYAAWRFWRGQLSANRKTLLPGWSLLLFGVYSLSGFGFVAFHKLSWPLLIEFGLILLAFLAFANHVGRRLKIPKDED